MAAGLNLPQSALDMHLRHGFEDDFEGFLTASSAPYYTVVTAVDGTVTVADAANGVVTIANAVASIGDNEDCCLAREPEAFLFAANKPLMFEARVRFTEVSTNTVNCFVGLTSAAGADLMINDGGGPRASGTTLAFVKRDGSLNWYAHARVTTGEGSTTTTELTAVNSLDKAAHAAGHASTYRRLRLTFLPKNSTQADLIYEIAEGTGPLVEVYKITDYVYTSAEEMQAVAYVKGGTAAAASVLVDYMWCYQAR